MQVGLDADAAAPIFETVTPDGAYRYQLLGNWMTVLVQKRKGVAPAEWNTTYVIRHGICNCQGYGYRAECKHVDIAQALTRAARQQAEEQRGAPAG